MPKITFINRTTLNGERESIDSKLEVIRQITNSNKGLILAPEYFLMDKGRPLSKSQTEQTEYELLEISKQNNNLIFPGTMISGHDGKYQNICKVFYNGKKLAEITKKSARPSDKDFSLLMGVKTPKSDFTKPITKDQVKNYLDKHTFRLNNKTYLVEICNDHPTFARANSNKTQIVDVQIILSNQIYKYFPTPRENLFLKDEGILLESNGMHPSSYAGIINNENLRHKYIPQEFKSTNIYITV